MPEGQWNAPEPPGRRGRRDEKETTDDPGRTFAPAAESVVDKRPRYDVGDLIGSGAQGLVFRAQDRDLSRPVAMKVLRPEIAKNSQQVWQFYAEARRTGSLEHAGIPAVYELGTTSTGEPYFTMRLVEGRTLHDLLNDLRAADPDAVKLWTLTKLVQSLQRVANAVEYAHSKDLIHRDLKPGNIALARHDEVLVLDWGLSKRLDPDEDDDEGPHSTALLEKTVHGQVKGTPLYMSPEQAMGDVTKVDRRADVFALGAILYELLALCPPYEGRSVQEVIREARRSKIQPPSARAPQGREIPKSLEETAMRALAKDPEHRHASAAAFAEELQSWLDGSRDRESRRREADALLRVALQVAKKAEEYRTRAMEADAEAARLRHVVAPWAEPSEKAELWGYEDVAVSARAKAAQADARAVELSVQALAHVPNDPTGRELLARTYLRWYGEALDREDASGAAWLLKMVRFYNDGSLDADLREDARLAVAADSDGSVVTLYRYVERARRLVPQDEVGSAPSPAIWESLPQGRYLAIVKDRRGATASIPVHLRAASRRTVVVPSQVFDPAPPGFVVIPGGPFLTGAGPGGSEVTVATFWMASTPVLLFEWALWLEHLWLEDSDSISAHVPWAPTHGPLLHRVGEHFIFCPGSPMAERPIHEHPELPVVGVTRSSARAYAAWLGGRLSRRVDLPTELQWEKAARGTDGRLYPWGDRFDPTFCSMAQSSPSAAELRPIGAFPTDVSPYGVRDMAGNIREWTRDDDPNDARAAIARGGGWNSSASECRAGSRWVMDPGTQSGSLGFRVVVEPGGDGVR